jgi:hypothetical protein
MISFHLLVSLTLIDSFVYLLIIIIIMPTGGTAGAVAMGANVACLMWMRTTVNYQYRNGGTFFGALRTLYADGGIPRFYRGVLPALVQGPLSRFGDTAANTGVLTMLDHIEATKDMNVGIKTACASAGAATFRIFLMPVDTVKVGWVTVCQKQKQGFCLLMDTFASLDGSMDENHNDKWMDLWIPWIVVRKAPKRFHLGVD